MSKGSGWEPLLLACDLKLLARGLRLPACDRALAMVGACVGGGHGGKRHRSYDIAVPMLDLSTLVGELEKGKHLDSVSVGSTGQVVRVQSGSRTCRRCTVSDCAKHAQVHPLLHVHERERRARGAPDTNGMHCDRRVQAFQVRIGPKNDSQAGSNHRISNSNNARCSAWPMTSTRCAATSLGIDAARVR
jgi:hypothetical protein